MNAVISCGLSMRSRASPKVGMSGLPDLRKKRSHGTGRLPAVIKQALRDIGEDHMTFRPEPLQGAEGDEAVTGAHVENGVIGPKPGLVEHRVADRVQVLGEILLAGLGIAAEAHVQQPPVPAVGSRRHG